MPPRGVLHNPRFNVVCGHRRRKKDVVEFEISMDDLAIVRMRDAVKQVKSYPFSEGKREGSCLRFDESFHVAPVYRHHETHMRASRAFSGNRELVQKLRAIRRGGRIRDNPERLWLPNERAFVHIRYIPGKHFYCNKLVATIKG